MPAQLAPSPVARPAETAPPPPDKLVIPTYSQLTNLTQEQQAALKHNLLNAGQRAAEMAERGAQELARQQEEARVRGDVAEVNRLEGILRNHRERMEKLRQRQLELDPGAQAGPTLQ